MPLFVPPRICAAFRVHRNGVNQTGIAKTPAFTVIQFTTKLFDTHNVFDNVTNFRVQPGFPGYWDLSLGLALLGMDLATQVAAVIEFNGGRDSEVTSPGQGSADPVGFGVNVKNTFYFNGTTDYADGRILHTAAANRDLEGYFGHCWFSGSFNGP